MTLFLLLIVKNYRKNAIWNYQIDGNLSLQILLLHEEVVKWSSLFNWW